MTADKAASPVLCGNGPCFKPAKYQVTVAGHSPAADRYKVDTRSACGQHLANLVFRQLRRRGVSQVVVTLTEQDIAALPSPEFVPPSPSAAPGVVPVPRNTRQDGDDTETENPS